VQQAPALAVGKATGARSFEELEAWVQSLTPTPVSGVSKDGLHPRDLESAPDALHPDFGIRGHDHVRVTPGRSGVDFGRVSDPDSA